MCLIVGLGNPGEKYKNNRHNAGFLFVDYLIKNLQSQNSNVNPPAGGQNYPERISSKFNGASNSKFKIDKYLMSEICELRTTNYTLHPDIILAKPQTFMNLSGVAVKKLVTKFSPPNTYPLTPNDLIIIHDDLDIPLGKFQIDWGRGPKMHNGIASIEKHLKTKNFWRVRIGIDNRHQQLGYDRDIVNKSTAKIDGETYVLQNFRPEEKKIIEELFPKIFQKIEKEFLTFLL